MRMAQLCGGLGITTRSTERKAGKLGVTQLRRTSEPSLPSRPSNSWQAPSPRSLGRWARARTAEAKEKEKEKAKARKAKAASLSGHASSAIPGTVHIGLSASRSSSCQSSKAESSKAAAAVQQTVTCTLPKDGQEPKLKKQKVRLQSPAGAGGTSRSAPLKDAPPPPLPPCLLPWGASMATCAQLLIHPSQHEPTVVCFFLKKRTAMGHYDQAAGTLPL